MYHFKYVTKAEARKVREKLENLVHEVQDEVRDNFTLQYYFIGSSARNMITYDPATNIGFDFDVNLEVNNNESAYSPEEIRKIIMKAFQKHCSKYGYNKFENSKRVFTIKGYNVNSEKVEHSCDIAIVNNFIDEAGTVGQKYIAFDKKSNSYSWQQQSKSFNLKEKENWLRQQPEVWNAVRERYLKRKIKTKTYISIRALCIQKPSTKFASNMVSMINCIHQMKRKINNVQKVSALYRTCQ